MNITIARVLFAEESSNTVNELLRLLQFWMVSGCRDRPERRARDALCILSPILRGHDAIGFTPQHKCRHSDPSQPVSELWIVHMRLPGVYAQRIPVPRKRDHFRVAHRIADRRLPAKSINAVRPTRGIMPRALVQLRLIGVEEMHDVAHLPSADLDADGIDQHQPVDLSGTRHRELSRNPSAETEADDMDARRGD